MKKVVISGMVGNTLEWYDYALYGHLATTIAALFFAPEMNEYVKLIYTFGIFAAGFLMRPLGAIIFGAIGDKFGRRSALTSSIILMAGATGCLCILPTYEQIGLAAPILLTIIRLLQGLSLGGEFSGAMLFVAESVPPKYRTVAASSSLFSACVGVLLGSFSATFFAKAMPEQFADWGWRIPMAIGVLIGIVGMYIRHSVPESPEYDEAKKKGKLAKTPVKDTFRKHKTLMLMGVALYLTVTVPFYTLVVFMKTFLSKMVDVPMDEGNALFINTIAVLVMTFTIPVAAYYSDKVGKKKFLIASAWLVLLVIYPCFHLLMQPGFVQPLLGQVIFALAVGMFLGPVPIVLVELFPISVRYTGMSLSYNFTAALFGGTLPMVATWMIKETGNPAAPAFYVIACALVTLYAMRWFNKDMRRAK